MAVTKNAISCFLVVIAILMGGCEGTVYRVGDSRGWTIMDVDYSDWASSKTFYVGDSIVFEYDMDFHDVTEVTEQDFQSCNPTSPLARFDSGSDSIGLTRPGHRYFICGVPGHCSYGQKLHVLVQPAASTMRPPFLPPTPSSSSSTSVLPPSGSSSPSAPSPLENSPTNAPDVMVSHSPVQNGASGPCRASLGLLALLAFLAVVGLLF